METPWIWLLVVLTGTFHQAVAGFFSTKYKLVSGLQMERVPSPSSHFYREYVPLVYQLKIPRWNKTSTVIHGSQNCNSTNYTKFFTTCPVLYYLNDLHERFSEYFGDNQPLVVNLENIGAKPETALIPFDCELVRPHFDDVFMDKVTIDEYLETLKSCSPLGSQEFLQGITNYDYNISSIYLDMRRSFYSEYWLKIDLIDGRVDAAIWANAINILNSLMFQNYMMEVNRWKMAVGDCEAGRIPSTLVSPPLLSDTLTDMVESLSTQNLVPTVSTDAVGNYYKAELTDCTFTNDSLLVRILIPVIPENEKFLLVKVSPLTFYYQDQNTDWQCQVDPYVLPDAGDNDESDESYVLVDLTKNIAYESDCKPGKLCHIPTALHPRKISPCATAAFNWERYKASNETVRRDLITQCPIKCSPVSKFKKDLLKQVTPFEYFLFSSEKNNTFMVNCSSSSSSSTGQTPKTVKTIAGSVPYGAQLFEMTCNCRFKYKSQMYGPKPCNSLRQSRLRDDFTQNVLAPVQWYSDDALKKNRIVSFLDVPGRFFNQPTIDLTQQSIRSSGSISGGNERSAGYLSSDSNSSNSSTYFIITVFLVLLLIIAMVGLLAYRLHTLIEQLKSMGLNVKGQNWYDVAGSTGNGMEQQVTYRNMGSLVDTDSLLINEGH